MGNPDALERRNTPMSFGRKLALAGSITLTAAGAGGVIYEAKSIMDLRDKQREGALSDPSLTLTERISIEDARVKEAAEIATIYLGSIILTAVGAFGAGTLISERKNSSQ